jgi:hypothetical protein
MPRVTLKHPAALSKEQARNAWRDGQKYFWIASPDFHFVNIGKHPAVYPLHIDVELPYGNYILGCGYGRCKLHRPFVVDMLGVKFK